MPTATIDNATIHYQLRGSGPPVLGIMGFGLDQRFWAAQIPAVTATHMFITFDNRGVGRSVGEPVTSIEDMAEDTVGLLDHLGIERAVVFGVSMGGAIAQRLALAHPERVSALILGLTWARRIEFMRRQHRIARAIIKMGSADLFVESTLVRMFTPSFFEMGEESVNRIIAAFLAESGPEVPQPDVLLAQLDALDEHECLAELSSIRVPTLVCGGEVDMLIPYFAQQEIAAAIPGAELATFSTGHGCMVEEMAAFNERVEAFLKRLVGGERVAERRSPQ
jgi:pimeloyl-ACP methyl ester carboxylesterase